MKLLVISQYFTPDITAAAYRISETVDGLNKNGIDVLSLHLLLINQMQTAILKMMKRISSE